jgi:GDP-L-fucose synthase
VWGSGKAIREFLHVDDLANAILIMLKINKTKLNKIYNNQMPIFNVGSNESISIKDLAFLIKKLIKFKGNIIFDKDYPDGTLNKNLDSRKLRQTNWLPKIKLRVGLNKVIKEREKIF